jgi:hypothetical protein
MIEPVIVWVVLIPTPMAVARVGLGAFDRHGGEVLEESLLPGNESKTECHARSSGNDCGIVGRKSHV